MNLLMLMLMIAVGIWNPMQLVGIIVGLAICYLFLDGRGKDSSIVYHLTHWSWFDWRV